MFPLLSIRSRTILRPCGSPDFATSARRAFTLVELLVVIAIIMLITALLVPAFTSMQKGGDLTRAAYDIKGTLDRARAYAMANNTFTFVAFFEADPSAATTTPATAGIGRVVVAAAASKDGTRGYDVNSATLSAPVWTNYKTNLLPLGKLLRFENVHLISAASDLSLDRPLVSDASYEIGSATCQAVTRFDWPIGKTIGSGQYSFTKVINFDPQGIARIQTASNQDDVIRTMEIGLIPTQGNVIPATTSTNAAVIQINAMTGATVIYRP